MPAPINYPTVLWAAEFANQPAIVHGAARVTHAELEHCIVTDASRLRELGVQPGDRVALGAANSPAWVILVHAVTRAGAILVPLSTRLTTAEILERLSLFTPRLILGDDDFLAKVPPGTPGSMNIHHLPNVRAGRHEIAGVADSGAISTIVSTSGTSGEPKGVCLTLANHLANAAASHQNLECGPDNRWLINLPLFHVGGLAIIYRAALCGFTIVIHDDFSAERTLAALRDEGVTHLSLVEATLARILELNGDQPFPESARAVLVGGGPVEGGLLRCARSLGLPVLPTYGLTEAASQAATMNPDSSDTDFKGGVPPLPACELEIRDSAGRRVTAGTEGEIWIRGPMITCGYWMPGGMIEQAADNGWLATGDMGVLDSGGFLSVRGRKDDMIISGGENIYPAEIERALTRLLGIRRAAVFGISDPTWGQIPVALVERDDTVGGSPGEWLNLLRDQLAGYKLPREIIPAGTLPVTSLGKLQRSCLPDIYRRLRNPDY